MESKFIQISSAYNGENDTELTALDDQGQVWFYRSIYPEDKDRPNGWVKLNPKRVPAPWEK